MRTMILILSLITMSWSSLSLAESKAEQQLPPGWIQAGSNVTEYSMGIDTSKGYSNNRSAFIESKSENPSGFSTMMQTADVSDYLGKRVKMTVYISSKDVSGWAGAWLRIDKGQDSVAFDNMNDRSITGSKDWEQHAIVLDVPKDASQMAFGVLMSGTGKVWFDNLNFEVVDNTVPVTDLKKKPLKKPTNLSFE